MPSDRAGGRFCPRAAHSHAHLGRSWLHPASETWLDLASRWSTAITSLGSFAVLLLANSQKAATHPWIAYLEITAYLPLPCPYWRHFGRGCATSAWLKART
jgi:hypothetical protein